MLPTALSFEADFDKGVGTISGRPFFEIAEKLRGGVPRGWTHNTTSSGAGPVDDISSSVCPNPIPRNFIYNIRSLTVQIDILGGNPGIFIFIVDVVLSADCIPLHCVHYFGPQTRNNSPPILKHKIDRLNIFVPYNYLIALGAHIQYGGGGVATELSVGVSIDGKLFESPHQVGHGQQQDCSGSEVELIEAYNDAAAWPAGGS